MMQLLQDRSLSSQIGSMRFGGKCPQVNDATGGPQAGISITVSSELSGRAGDGLSLETLNQHTSGFGIPLGHGLAAPGLGRPALLPGDGRRLPAASRAG